MIAGSFTTATDAPLGTLSQDQMPLYIPQAKLPGNFVTFGTFDYAADGQPFFKSNVPYTFYTIKSVPGTAMGKIATSDGTITSPLALTPQIAYQYDSKFDDGDPITGRVVASDHSGGAGASIFLDTPGATTCRATSDTYNVTYNQYACRLSIISSAWPK